MTGGRSGFPETQSEESGEHDATQPMVRVVSKITAAAP